MSESGAKTVGESAVSVEAAEGFVWAHPEQHATPMPDGREGGLAVDGDGNLWGVKHPLYRLPHLRSMEGVYESDRFRLEGLGHARSDMPHTGVEVELLSVDASGEPSSLRDNSGQPLTDALAELVGEHPELLTYTAEIDDGPHQTPREAARGVFSKFKLLQAALPQGVAIDPASAWMGERPNETAVTKNPYVAVMVQALGEDRIMDFVGHGVHEHYDIATEHIHVVARYLQLTAPLLNAGLQAAPYLHEQLEPRLSEVFSNHPDVDALREVEDEAASRSWHSVRYPTRAFASPGGGVALDMTHETMNQLLRFADVRLRDGSVNNVSRAYGPHRDVRTRYDLPPGRVEFCAKDNPLGRVETMQAYMELTWAIAKAVEDAAEQGDSALEQLHANFADLFGREANPTEMKPEFEKAHRNSLRLAKEGPLTMVEDGHGCFVPVRHQILRLFDLARSSGYGLSDEAQQTVLSSLRSDLVASGATFDDYYRTGVGTPADYHHRQAQRMADTGLGEKKIIKELAKGRAKAFSGYLATKAA